MTNGDQSHHSRVLTAPSAQREHQRAVLQLKRKRMYHKLAVRRQVKMEAAGKVSAWERKNCQLAVACALEEVRAQQDAVLRGWAPNRRSRATRRIQRSIDERIAAHQDQCPALGTLYTQAFDTASLAELYMMDPQLEQAVEEGTYNDIAEIEAILREMDLGSDTQSNASTDLLCSETMSEIDIEECASEPGPMSEMYSPRHPTSISAEIVPEYDPARPVIAIKLERETSTSSSSSSSSSDEGASQVGECGGLQREQST